MARVSVPEAAQRLSVSVATVRRRIRSGVLKGTQDDPPNGKWWVELPDDSPALGEPDGDSASLRELVEILREELVVKNKQIEQLHILLQQAQVALPAARQDRPWWRRWWQHTS